MLLVLLPFGSCAGDARVLAHRVGSCADTVAGDNNGATILPASVIVRLCAKESNGSGNPAIRVARAAAASGAEGVRPEHSVLRHGQRPAARARARGRRRRGPLARWMDRRVVRSAVSGSGGQAHPERCCGNRRRCHTDSNRSQRVDMREHAHGLRGDVPRPQPGAGCARARLFAASRAWRRSDDQERAGNARRRTGEARRHARATAHADTDSLGRERRGHAGRHGAMHFIGTSRIRSSAPSPRAAIFRRSKGPMPSSRRCPIFCAEPAGGTCNSIRQSPFRRDDRSTHEPFDLAFPAFAAVVAAWPFGARCADGRLRVGAPVGPRRSGDQPVSRTSIHVGA